LNVLLLHMQNLLNLGYREMIVKVIELLIFYFIKLFGYVVFIVILFLTIFFIVIVVLIFFNIEGRMHLCYNQILVYFHTNIINDH
jgi:hypothetical protein